MQINLKLLLISVVLLLIVVNVRTDSITPVLTAITTLIEAIKLGNDMMDLVMKYPPILYEQIVAAFDKEKPLPNRSYDFIVDLTRPTDIFEGVNSYPVTFPLGKNVYDEKVKEEEDRFIVNVIGKYNVGKTYVLRLLANIDLGHSFTERTIGISISLPSSTETDNTPLALIDTAGTRTPVAYQDDTFQQKSYQRQVSDSFIQEIAFNSADIFILVVNQMTLDDQLYLKALTKRLRNKNLGDDAIKQRLLIVHNYYNLHTIEEVEHVEQVELKHLFGAKKNRLGFWISQNFKHFVIAHTNSSAGEFYNKKSIALIRTMIKGANAVLYHDVLNKILTEIQLLLTDVLVEQPIEFNSQKENFLQQMTNYIAAIWQGDKKQDFKISNKKKIKIELELRNVTVVDSMLPLWFICPKNQLSTNISLSKNLRFNHDGSIYIDFSTQFVPNINIVRLNDDGDISIRVECPLCAYITAIRKGMTAILIQGEKVDKIFQKQYFNTRKMGKFEMEIELKGLESDLVLNIEEMTIIFADGVANIYIPTHKRIIDEL